MKKKALLLLLGLCIIAGGCGVKQKGKPIEVEDKVIQQAEVQAEDPEEGEPDVVNVDIESDGYVMTEPCYGIRLQVPSYLNFDSEELENHKNLVYNCYDEGVDITAVSLSVSGDAWDSVELCDIGDVTSEKAVYEDIIVDDDGSAMGCAHYFFMTDSNNLGSDHEFQVLVHVHGRDKDSVEAELAQVMDTMDLSGFYYDNFAS